MATSAVHVSDRVSEGEVSEVHEYGSSASRFSFDMFAGEKPAAEPASGAVSAVGDAAAPETTTLPQKEPSAAKKPRASFRPSFVEGSLLLYSVFYAAVSRVPFTLFAIYMIDVLHFAYLMAALTLGLYCFGRLLGAHLAGMYLGSLTLVFGTAAGGISWGCILMFEEQWVFVVSSFLLGFTETVTGLDTMLKIESLILRRTPEQTQMVFRCQLICTCVGVFIAYMGGGFLYKIVGMRAVGLSCVAFTCINLVILSLLYSKRRVYRQPSIRLGDIMEEYESAAPTKARKSRMSVAGKEGGAKQRVTTRNIDAIEIQEESEDGKKAGQQSDKSAAALPGQMASSFFLGTVVACFFFTTLGISTQFAISALYWQRIWSVGPDVVGTIMAVGECIGVCLLVLFAQPRVFDSPLTRYFGKPANVLNACLGMGVMCFLITANSMVACCIGSVGVHMFNVCVHSFQAELVGVCAPGESFATWISYSYVVKRLANCVCVFGSIVFFDAFGPRASYRVIGSGLIAYATVLCVVYWYIKALPCQLRRSGKREPSLYNRASVVAVA